MVGVLLLNMGGPDSLQAVRPFLFNLFSDREIIQLGPRFIQPAIAWWIAKKRAPKSRKAYSRIGGMSPLASITRAQASAVEALVNRQGGVRICCRPGMRYWHPRTPQVLAEFREMGIRQVVALSLYPHYSRATSGSSLADFAAAARKLQMETAVIDSFPDHPGYVEALAETVWDGLDAALGSRVPREPWSLGDPPENFALVYSAHSLPRRMVEEGDPYVEHIHRTIAPLERRTGIKGTLCFQSRSGPVKWLEPATDVCLAEIAGKGVRRILILPISFVSDHVETLYEIDVLYADTVAGMGGRLFRTPSLNDRPGFIQALAGLVELCLKEAGWRG